MSPRSDPTSGPGKHREALTTPPTMLTTTKAATLASDLVRRFEEQIEKGEMAPGARFPTEKAMTEAVGVSRTVVREAYSRLAARGLLVSRRGSGAYVPDDARYRAFQIAAAEFGEIEDVLRLLEMRIGFEAEMADLAARRRTDEDLARIRCSLDEMENSIDTEASVAADAAFHAAIAAATRNDYFVRFTQFLGVRLVPSRIVCLQEGGAKRHRQYARTINKDHRAIYEAIEAGNPVAAHRAARRHMEKSIERHRATRRLIPGA